MFTSRFTSVTGPVFIFHGVLETLVYIVIVSNTNVPFLLPEERSILQYIMNEIHRRITVKERRESMPDVIEINSSALTLQKQEALKRLYPHF